MSNNWSEAFLQEAEELLAEIEECALNTNGGADTDEVVGRLFRAFHTIKGSSGICGLNHVADFTHHVESLLDDVREGRVIWSARIADLVLASADEIKRLMISDPALTPGRSGASQALITMLAAEASEHAPQQGTPRRQNATDDIEEGQERVWKIVFRPNPNLFLSGGNPLSVLRELEDLGSTAVEALTDAVPTLDKLQPDKCYLGWNILLTTTANINAIRDVFVFVEDGAEISIERVNGDECKAKIPEDKAPMVRGKSHGNQHTDARSTGGARGAGRRPGPIDPGKAHRNESQVRVPAARLDRLVNLVGELVMNQSRLAQAASLVGSTDLDNPVQEMERLVAELRDNVLSIRMLPIGTIFGRFRRLVHDLSAELGKEVDLVTEGAETELDKSILDQLGDPLVHLLRNAIDHGIETAEKRVELGKPLRGTIRLNAQHTGSHVVISVEDDGKGINREAVRAKAQERKLISADASLSDREIINLILLPGFSTAEHVTNVSGRGVGMDVVKRQIDALRGSLVLESEEGKGSKIALSLPLTLAIIEGLNVEIGQDHFIIPMSAITENVELEHTQRTQKNGRNVVVVRGELVPYIDLRAVFQVEGTAPQIEKIVIVRHGEDRVGLVVDRVLGTHQTVLQSLGRFFRNIDVVSGATIMGDGRVALILDIPAVVHFVERQNKQSVSQNSRH